MGASKALSSSNGIQFTVKGTFKGRNIIVVSRGVIFKLNSNGLITTACESNSTTFSNLFYLRTGIGDVINAIPIDSESYLTAF